MIIITKQPLCFIYVDMYIDHTTRQPDGKYQHKIVFFILAFTGGLQIQTSLQNTKLFCTNAFAPREMARKTTKRMKRAPKSVKNHPDLLHVDSTSIYFNSDTFWSPFPPFITLSLCFDAKYLCVLFRALLDGLKHTPQNYQSLTHI